MLQAKRMVAALVFLMVASVVPVAAQRGSIAGQVVARETRQPLVGVQVYIEGTSFGQISQENGRFTITNVPAGTYTVIAKFIGYADGRHENVRVRGDQPTTVDFEIATTALRLERVVVTGTIDPVAGNKIPYSNAKITKEDLPVPAQAPMQSLQGKVSGVRVVRGNGQPGSQGSIQLRGVTSISRQSDPLIVIDGVISSESLIDIDSQDIESIEVVKGAAGASLYGSRAASGVIQITTNRGRDLPENTTRISMRSEFGQDVLPTTDRFITKHHHYLVDPVKGWVDAAGNAVTKDRRVVDPNQIADNPYPGPIYNHIDRFFDPGTYLRNNLSISQNSMSTNFTASLTHQEDAGVVPGNDGFQMMGLRVNLDHRLRRDVMFQVSTYYSKTKREEFQGDPFYDLMFMPPDVDLGTLGDDGKVIILPDPFTLQANPLYSALYSDNYGYRGRFMGSGVIRYSPAPWFNVESNFAYDRSDRNTDNFTPIGYRTGINSTSAGSVTRRHERTIAWNGGVSASFLHTIGDLTMRARTQYLLENDQNDSRSAGGSTLSVVGVPQVDVGTTRTSNSEFREVKSSGLYLITGMDYAGKYVLDGLVRRDGSSLFGPENRWHTYYRLAGAWLMNEESWWRMPSVSLFKLRYSIGTAGGRPNFADRFETWSVSGAGIPSKGGLGNNLLAPEHKTEQEFGMDVALHNRYSLTLVHARSTTSDQLLNVPLLALYGYGSQWQNAGTLKSKTFEAELEAVLVNSRNLTWKAGLVADRSRTRTTELNRPCFIANDVVYYCPGIDVGKMYGYKFTRSLKDLSPSMQANASEFQVNDDGYVVWVGPGNTYREGLSKNLWGTQTTIAGQALRWGEPFRMTDSTGGLANLEIGDSNPDLNLGFNTTVQWRGLQFYGLLDARLGGQAYNNTHQWAYRDKTHADYDQTGKPDELKKPVNYYLALYNTNSRNSAWVEENTYLKLRELSVNYTFRREQLQRVLRGMSMERLSIGFIGRNLLTFTDYVGFDPEIGNVRRAYDGFDYPNFRNYTLSVNVSF
jgi:TonB-linked SusC/RagA family outer membrane protein